MIQRNGEISHALGLEELILLKGSYYPSNPQIQCNPYQNTQGIFHRTRTDNFKICMDTQKTPNSQQNLQNEEQSWGNHAP